MDRLLRLMLSNSVFANMLMLLVIAGGLAAFLSMRREGMPPVNLDLVSVRVDYPGAAPEEVEEGIARKVEDVLQGLDGVKKVQIKAMEGACMAVIEGESGADIHRIKADVSDAIDTITTFPQDSKQPEVKVVRFESQVLMISLWGELEEYKLRDLSLDLKDDCYGVQGVSKVTLLGVRDVEIAIECSEVALRSHGLSFAEVTEAVRRGSVNLPGGSIRSRSGTLQIRTLGQAYRAEEFERIVVRADGMGHVIRVGDVATVRDGAVEEGGIGRFNGHRSVNIMVEKGNHGDSLVISSQLHQLVERWRARLPEGVHLNIWQDMSTMIRGRIDLLTSNGWMGLGLVLLVLWIFMDIRLSFWVGMGIPISLLGGLAIIALGGHTINMINLFGMIMVLGILVDNAIVVGEAIYLQRKKGLEGQEAVLEGVREVFWPVVASDTTTIVAFVPLFFVSGIMGKFIAFLPPIVVCALIISLLECLFLLPVHLRHNKLKKFVPGREPFSVRVRSRIDQVLQGFIQKIYAPFLKLCLGHRHTVLAISIGVVLMTAALVNGRFIKFITFPDIDADYIFARIEYPEGTPIEKTEDGLKQMELAWRRVEERIGQKLEGPLTTALYAAAGSIKNQQGFSKGDHLGQIILELMPAEKRNIYYKDLIKIYREEIGVIAGAVLVKVESQEYGPGGADVEVWLLSDDDGVRGAATARFKAELMKMEGVSEVWSSDRPGKQEIRLTLKSEAAYYGMTLRDIAQQVRQGFFGPEVFHVQRDRDDLEVRLRFTRPEREELQSLEEMRIVTPTGERIPLPELVHFDMQPGYTVIDRFMGKRRTAITASVDGKIITSGEVHAELDRSLFPELLSAYPDLRLRVEGQARQTHESIQSMFYGLLLAILAIYLIIASVFHSYLQPMVVMLAIPLGIAGAVLGHGVMGMALSMFSLFGIVALTGVVVNDSIVLVDAINENLRSGLSLLDAVKQGGERRFRPIMLTTVTTIVGLSPIMLEKSMQAQFLIPMAVSMVFGVGFATLLTLFVVPCVIVILDDLRRLFHWHLTGLWPSEAEVSLQEMVSPSAPMGDVHENPGKA